jgi:hypothetical protein
VAEGGNEGGHDLAPPGAVGFTVGGDHSLVDAPGGFDFDVSIGGEQLLEPSALLVGEEVRAGVQGAPGPVERIGGAAPVAVDDLLDPAAAAVEGVAG